MRNKLTLAGLLVKLDSHYTKPGAYGMNIYVLIISWIKKMEKQGSLLLINQPVWRKKHLTLKMLTLCHILLMVMLSDKCQVLNYTINELLVIMIFINRNHAGKTQVRLRVLVRKR